MNVGDEFDPRFSVCGFHPDAVVSSDTSLGLSSLDKRLHGRLVVYRHRGSSVFPGIETLAKELAASEKTVRRGLKRLAEVGLISWVKAGRSNLYSFLFHQIFVGAAREAGTVVITADKIPVKIPDTTPVIDSGHRSNQASIPVKKAPDTGHSCDRLSTEVHEVQTNEERKPVTNTGQATTDKPPADSFIEQIRTIIDLSDILGRKPDDGICRKVIAILGYPAAIPFLKEQMRDAREGEIRSYGLIASVAKDARGRYDVAKKLRAKEEKQKLDQEPPHESQVRSWLEPFGLSEQLLEKAAGCIMSPDVLKNFSAVEIRRKLVSIHAESQRPTLQRQYIGAGVDIAAAGLRARRNGKAVVFTKTMNSDEVVDTILHHFRVEIPWLAVKLGKLKLPKAHDEREHIKQIAEAFIARSPISDDLLDRLVTMAAARPMREFVGDGYELGSLERLAIDAPILAKQWRGLIQGFCPVCRGRGWKWIELGQKTLPFGNGGEWDCDCIRIWSPMDPTL